MFLLIQPRGHKYWRLSYRFGGTQKTLGLGVYPQVSLKDARQARDTAKKTLAEGRDPSIERKTKKASLEEDSFEAVARDWPSNRRRTWSDSDYRNTVGCPVRCVALDQPRLGCLKRWSGSRINQVVRGGVSH